MTAAACRARRGPCRGRAGEVGEEGRRGPSVRASGRSAARLSLRARMHSQRHEVMKNASREDRPERTCRKADLAALRLDPLARLLGYRRPLRRREAEGRLRRQRQGVAREHRDAATPRARAGRARDRRDREVGRPCTGRGDRRRRPLARVLVLLRRRHARLLRDGPGAVARPLDREAVLRVAREALAHGPPGRRHRRRRAHHREEALARALGRRDAAGAAQVVAQEGCLARVRERRLGRSGRRHALLECRERDGVVDLVEHALAVLQEEDVESVMRLDPEFELLGRGRARPKGKRDAPTDDRARALRAGCRASWTSAPRRSRRAGTPAR